MDAQYGTNVTWDYYKNVFGRNGIFGNVLGRPGQANGQDGLTIVDSAGNQVGGPGLAGIAAIQDVGAGPGNVISGNGQYGIRLVGAGSRGNRIDANRIGTDREGRAAQGNDQARHG